MGNGGAGKVGLGGAEMIGKEKTSLEVNPEGANFMWSTTHKQKCVLCGGPIWAGDLVMTFDNGLIHLLKKTCDDFKKGKIEAKPKDPKDRPPRNCRLKVKKAGT
jgi:hypothetical protein